ncbi:hypothetical protein [Euzebya sp.]|uniref:hypothetical protein n=1 Tax=Euzebya sp. TaxID=1971409 RepID=UPI0035188266
MTTTRAEVLSTVDLDTVFNVAKSHRRGRRIRRPASRWRTIDGQRLTAAQRAAVEAASWEDWALAVATLQTDAAQARLRGEWWHELDDLLGRHWTPSGQIIDALAAMNPDEYARAVELLELCGLLKDQEAS